MLTTFKNVPSIAAGGHRDRRDTILSEDGRRFCENCGTEIRQTTNFCPNCGAAQRPDPEIPTGPLSPTFDPGRRSTRRVSDVPLPPPPPATATPAQEGLAGSRRNSGLGARAYIGMAVALLVLLVIAVGGCALLLADADSSRGTMEKITQQLSGGKQEATGEV